MAQKARSNTTLRGVDKDSEVKKRGHDTDTEDAPRKKARNQHEDGVSGKKSKRNDGPLLRSPLPKRRGRNEDPVGKRAKAARAAEAKAKKIARKEDKEKEAAEAEAAKDKLADMEIDESFVRMEEDQQRIRRLSDMEATANGEKADSPEDEVTDSNSHEEFSEESEAESESLVGDRTEQSRKRAPKKKKSPPTLRGEIAEKKASTKSKIRGSRKNLPVASGLSTEWVKAQKVVKAQKTKKNPTSTEVTQCMDDEAALSTRPDYPPSPMKFDRKAADALVATKITGTSRSTRKNILVAPVSESEDSDDSDSDYSGDSSHATRLLIKPRSVPSSGKAKCVSKPTDKGKASKLRKTSTHLQASDASTTSRSDAARNLIMPKGGNIPKLLCLDITTLKPRYLSIIFHALDASEAPFDDFTKTSPHFLKVSRLAFREIWPRLNITLETDDVLFNVGYQRVVERRGRIYEIVQTSLETYFSSKRYSHAEIVEWVKWFCSTHGSPIFYEISVPQDGEWDPNKPYYQKPRGFLKNKHMIDIGTRFLQDSTGAKCDFGPPRGLFVLIMTAFERAARAYKTGIYVKPGDFSAKSCNPWVKAYSKNFAGKSVEWWEKLLECYDVAKSEPEKVGDMSILDETRGALPMSSSP